MFVSDPYILPALEDLLFKKGYTIVKVTYDGIFHNLWTTL